MLATNPAAGKEMQIQRARHLLNRQQIREDLSNIQYSPARLGTVAGKIVDSMEATIVDASQVVIKLFK